MAPTKRYAVGDEKLDECALVVCGHEARHAALEGVEIHRELMKAAARWGRFGGEGGRQRSALGLPLHTTNPCVTY
jgi:hypothetical protein